MTASIFQIFEWIKAPLSVIDRVLSGLRMELECLSLRIIATTS